jgi:hypothetical protein
MGVGRCTKDLRKVYTSAPPDDLTRGFSRGMMQRLSAARSGR